MSKPHKGFCSSKSTDFAICQGQYEKDMKNGEGVFIWPDGRSYRGQWQGHPPRQSTDLEDKGVDDINGIFVS